MVGTVRAPLHGELPSTTGAEPLQTERSSMTNGVKPDAATRAVFAGPAVRSRHAASQIRLRTKLTPPVIPPRFSTGNAIISTAIGVYGKIASLPTAMPYARQHLASLDLPIQPRSPSLPNEG
jgi:hypothetical protein